MNHMASQLRACCWRGTDRVVAHHGSDHWVADTRLDLPLGCKELEVAHLLLQMELQIESAAHHKEILAVHHKEPAAQRLDMECKVRHRNLLRTLAAVAVESHTASLAMTQAGSSSVVLRELHRFGGTRNY